MPNPKKLFEGERVFYFPEKDTLMVISCEPIFGFTVAHKKELYGSVAFIPSEWVKKAIKEKQMICIGDL